MCGMDSSLPLHLDYTGVRDMLHDTHHIEKLFELAMDYDPEVVVENFNKLDYGDLKGMLQLFAGNVLNLSVPEDEYHYVWDSPMAAKLCNYLEEKYTDRDDKTNLMIHIMIWMTFSLDRIFSRMKKKFGDISGDEALDQIDKRRAVDSGCPFERREPVDPEFEKRLREEADMIADFWKDRFNDLCHRNDVLLDGLHALQDAHYSLEERHLLLERRNEILERENRASAEAKRNLTDENEENKMNMEVLEEKLAEAKRVMESGNRVSAEAKRMLSQEIENLTKADEERKEAMKVLEEKLANAVLEQERMAKEWEEKEEIKGLEEECQQLKEKIVVEEFKSQIKDLEEEKAHLKQKNQVLESKELEMTKKDKKKEERIKEAEKMNDALQGKYKETLSQIKDFEEEMKMMKGVKEISEKFDAVGAKNYAAGLYEFFASKHPGMHKAGSPEWRMFEAQLLLPILVDKEMAEKMKTSSKSDYNKIVDRFANLGLRLT